MRCEFLGCEFGCEHLCVHFLLVSSEDIYIYNYIIIYIHMYHRYHIMYATSICLRVGSNNSSFFCHCSFETVLFLQSCVLFQQKTLARHVTPKTSSTKKTQQEVKKSPRSPSVPFSVESPQPKILKTSISLFVPVP